MNSNNRQIRHGIIATLGFGLLLSSNEAAQAIPSPELVIGSASSLGQVFALAAALLGGGAALAGSRSRGRIGTQNSKWLVRGGIILMLACLVSASINIWQYTQTRNARLLHLEATLNRPAETAGQKIQDKNLKTMSYDKQMKNPLGITTDEAAALLARVRRGDTSALFVDVREDGENLMGTLPGATHIRYPDLKSSGIDTAGKQLILFCHNGNRSSETCTDLAAQGGDCRFISGGMEKWIVEGRALTNTNVRDLSDLRALPKYKNDTVLLDTEQIKTLVAKENIQFADLRYPADFATGHLPGAINIPLRAMPTRQLNKTIAELPDRPIVAACYDRRSCFMSQVLGFELTKAGKDFRGRYTVPWEYFIPKAPKPHVAKWLAQRNMTYWQKAVKLLASGLLWITEQSHPLLAVFLLALASRLLILPIAIKAEKDQLVAARTKPELSALKEQLRDDPKRMARAIKGFYTRHGLTPMRNMLALVFLPVMMLGLGAVEQVADQIGPVLWLDDAGTADPLYILPVLFTLLGGFYLQMALAVTPRGRILCWVLGAPVLFLLVFRLSGLGNVYLCTALLLLLVQRAFVTGRVAKLRTSLASYVQARKINRFRGIIPLSATPFLTGCGNKALRLSQMARAGISVPDGVVLNHRFLKNFAQASGAERRKLLDHIWKMTGEKPLAVRSSAAAEDGENQSFAGVFESELNIDRDGLETAIERVYASFSAMRVGSYADVGDKSDVNILVQQMVQAEYSGVLFSRDPQAAGMMVIEYVKGTADDLVSGRITPETLRISRQSGIIETDTDCPVDLQVLRKTALQAEALFGHPQDIEWTWQGGMLRLVQSRDITTLGAGPVVETAIYNEWVRTIDQVAVSDAEKIVLELDEMSEVLPRPSPLSLSYMQEIWAPGGSVDLACRRLGIEYAPDETAPSHLLTVFARLYADSTLKQANKVELTTAAMRRLKKADSDIENSFRKNFMPDYLVSVNLWNAVDFNKLSDTALRKQLATIYDDFVHWTHTEIETINIAAAYYSAQAKSACDAAGLMAQELLAGDVSYSPAGLIQQAASRPAGRRREWLKQQMGHRSVFDYELSEPRYSETPETLEMLLQSALSTSPPNPSAKPLEVLDPELTRLIERARRYQALKEEAKHNALLHLSVIRRVVLAMDRVFGNDGLVFYLRFADLLDEQADTHALMLQARQTRDDMRLFNKQPSLPARINTATLELASSPFAKAGSASKHSNQGNWVSGAGPLSGRAYVVDSHGSADNSTLEGFEEGDILLCSMVHPMWLPYVLKSAGVVSEVGGWLSHMSIVARENGVAMLVGMDNLSRFETGQIISITEDGGISIAKGKPALRVAT